jgi:hypothetical protein
MNPQGKRISEEEKKNKENQQWKSSNAGKKLNMNMKQEKAHVAGELRKR